MMWLDTKHTYRHFDQLLQLNKQWVPSQEREASL